jgi:hypothetical protein
MKRIEIKNEYKGKTFDMFIPLLGITKIQIDAIIPEQYEYWLNKGYGHLFDIIEEDEPKLRVIEYKGIEPTNETPTQTVEDKPKNKRGRKPKAK